jgi:steroid 5-alpha reductase family enzyme
MEDLGNLTLSLWACGGAIALTWLLSVLTNEYSWVDRVWSILPPIYAWIFTRGPAHPRAVLLAALITLWGARLTWNFARKGGYARGGEDYRWKILRERMHPALYQAFNLLFIAGYQNVLIFLFTLPVFYAAKSTAPWGLSDALGATLFLVLLAGETIADNQQWAFHEWKRTRSNPSPRFLQTGLFRFSRHPNYFCEQGQWWVVYGVAALATGQFLGAALLGPVLLTLLFHGSAQFTESITLAKYPEYKSYQARVSRMIPWPSAPGESLPEPAQL